MGKYIEKYLRQKEIYDALKDDVEDLIIAVVTHNSDEIVNMIDTIIKYNFTKPEEFQIFKTIDIINAKKGEQE